MDDIMTTTKYNEFFKSKNINLRKTKKSFNRKYKSWNLRKTAPRSSNFLVKEILDESITKNKPLHMRVFSSTYFPH